MIMDSVRPPLDWWHGYGVRGCLNGCIKGKVRLRACPTKTSKTSLSLRKENEALKKGASSGVRMKVSEKGAVSIYGMGRFPVTLYKEQWLKLLDMSAEIRAFIADNEAQLKRKD
jgi:hypothetical protein